MKKFTYVLLCLVIAVSSHPLLAKKLGDLNFKDSVKVANAVLQLNGVGYRTKFFFKIYAGALYTQKKVSSQDAVQALTGPKRVVMHFIYSEVDREKLVDGWNEGFEENTSAEKLKVLEPRIKQFDAMFGDLKAGDVVVLDYIPGMGTQVTIKGEIKGMIKGKDFNVALLDIWLGENPADDDLKDAMLGENDDEDD